MSESLGVLIDDLLTEERGAADIRAIVPDIAGDLGAYWQQTLTFLDIALTYWPHDLAAKGHEDSARLRGAAAGPAGRRQRIWSMATAR